MTLRVLRHGIVDSTSERAFAALADGSARHGDVHVAEGQSAGRGRLGRLWASAPGEGLYASLVLLPGPPYRFAEGGWRLHRPAPAAAADPATVKVRPTGAPGSTGNPDEPPLRGIRVLDFTTVWSGPYLTQLLADLGAEVIRVENPSVFPPTTKGYLPRPDPNMLLGSLLSMYAPPVDGVEDRPYNRHAMNNSIARNKLSCTIDPRRPEGHELLMRLVEHSDVFVENRKMSTLHQIGIHESVLLDRNPRMLVLRIPPAGLTGDYANYTGFGAQFAGQPSRIAQGRGHLGLALGEVGFVVGQDVGLALGGQAAQAVPQPGHEGLTGHCTPPRMDSTARAKEPHAAFCEAKLA